MIENSKFAVVTGASSGIGLELARQFALNGYDVLLCAEDDGLEAAAADVATAGGRIETVQADLATTAGNDKLLAALIASGRGLDALVLNAGFGNSGAFVDIPLVDEQRLLALNIGSVVHLAKGLLPQMITRGAGGLLLTASIAATMPGPYYATYAASKAFVLSFAEAIRHELKDSGVTVTALMPGATDTAFFERAGMADTPVNDAKKDDPAAVAQDGFKAFLAGKDHVVAGSNKNKLQTATARLMSEPRKAATHARMTKPENR